MKLNVQNNRVGLKSKRELEDMLDLLAAIKQVPRWQRTAEARLSRNLASITSRTLDAILDEISTRDIPSNAIQRAALIRQYEQAEGELTKAMLEAAEEAAVHGHNRVIDDLRKQGIPISKPHERMNATINRIREHALERTQRKFSGTRTDIKNRLAELYEKGVRGDDAVADLKEYFDGLEDWDIKRLARTEINTSQSEAAHETMQDYNAHFKQWLSAGADGRTRESHLDLHGQITRIDVPFHSFVTGVDLMYPHCPGAPAEEVINCRCRERGFIMPPGKRPPPGKDHFWEADLISA